MSYSLWVTVDHEDGYVSTFTIVDGQTHNMRPFWEACGLIPQGGSTRYLDGKSCAEMQGRAVSALLDYLTDTGKYEALDPPNGWGDHTGWFADGLLPFVKMVHRHPRGVIHWEG